MYYNLHDFACSSKPYNTMSLYFTPQIVSATESGTQKEELQDKQQATSVRDLPDDLLTERSKDQISTGVAIMLSKNNIFFQSFFVALLPSLDTLDVRLKTMSDFRYNRSVS